MVWERSAAAAAAEDNDAVEGEFLRKAEVAARAAAEFGATLFGGYTLAKQSVSCFARDARM